MAPWIMMLLLCLNKVAPAPAAPLANPGCSDRCGAISIPYPFGIGANCWAEETYSITCNNSFNPPRPVIDSINLELLEISLEEGTIRVNNPIITSNCPNRVNGLQANLIGTPFSFSDTHSSFTAMGCNNLALITQQDEIIGGCMSICNVTSRDRSCFGILCCQTRIPPSLKFINASLRSIDLENDRQTCKYGFMVDQEWFDSLTDPFAVREMKNVPVVLEWRTFGTCNSFGFGPSTNTSESLCGANSLCSNLTAGYLCPCDQGYEGNPYLSDGCQNIDECANKTTNVCADHGSLCRNMPGYYICYCPPGFILGGFSCFKINKNRDRNRPILIGICSAIGVLLLLIGMWWLWKIMKRRKKNQLRKKFFKRNGGLLLQHQLSSSEGNVEQTKVFTSKELEKATDYYNQNRILGQGGQGTVYKGMMTDGRIVAIKKSKLMDEGKLEQFINEVVILSQINHRNVVKIFGCCLETEVPLLVYEFIPNGTLFQYIHEENEEFPLSWDKRVQIAAEAAGALSYLHSAASIPIYHRDIKSSNILLDEKYGTKVADFGTSKSLAIDQTHLTTRVMGTFGYLDPEYFQSSQFTEKSDVYSFGVVLVELLTGQKALSSTISEDGRSLATHFILRMKENKLYEMLDARVLKEGDKEEIMVVANLAKRCLNLSEKKRPTMKEVATELEGIRASKGAPIAEKDNEDVEYETTELFGPWDVTSTSTGSNVVTRGSLSVDVKPLLFE